MLQRVLILLLSLLLIGTTGNMAWAGCATYPATGTFQLVGNRSNGAIRVQFDVSSETNEPTAELIFRLRRPGEPVPENTQGVREPIALVAGTTTTHSYEFVPTVPGQYTVYAVVVASGRDWRRGFEQVALIDVPQAGGAAFISKKLPEEAATGPSATGALSAWDRPKSTPACQPEDVQVAPKTEKAGTSFKVYGTFKYTDRKYLEGAYTGTQELPIRNAFIRILDVEPGDTTQEVGITYTDALGKFSCLLQDNDDGPPSEGTRDIRIEVNCDSADAFVTFLDSTATRGSNYGDFTNWPGGDLNIGTVVFSLEQSGKFNILDNAQKAQVFARSKGEATARMRLKWESGKEITSYYKRDEKSVVICGALADSDEFDDDVILHECGHYMMNRFSYDRSPGGNHTSGGLYAPSLAWSEGWATYFDGMVDYNRFYVDHSASDFFAYNLESSEYDDLGDRNEDAVSSMLWDVYDGPVDGVDTLSDGSQRSWNIFTNDISASDNATFRDFYDAWKFRNYPKFDTFDSLANVHGMEYSAAMVTYPTAAGVAATIGSSMNIKWVDFPGANVRIDLLQDGNPNFLIAASTPNDGSFLWTPPSNTPLGPNARIRVYTTDQISYYDSSDNNFHVYPKPAKLTLNVSKTGNLTGIGDEDWYSINITTTKSYTINTFSGGLTDSYLTLWGPNSQVTKITEDDDSGTGNMSRIVRNLSPGTYYLQVETITGGQSGTYSIRVSN